MEISMAQQKKPNILLVMADDVGWFDVGAYHLGIMGAPTPNIERIAHDGVMLTDCYAQASCTAGRAAFITGQIPMRTGLTTVGLPGAPQGLQPEDPTLAELLKPEGYRRPKSGRTTSAIAINFSPPFTASTNSTATCTISMPRRSLSKSTIPEIIPPLRSFSSRAAYWNAKRPTPTIPRKTLALEE
jgi:Sulfatase